MKKLICLLCVIAMLTALAACQTQDEGTTTTTTTAENGATETTTEEPAETVTMTYLIPGNLNDDEEMVMEEINARLDQDGVGIHLRREAIPWDVWADRLNIKLTGGEEFDMFHIMQDWIPYNNYYARGALVDITDLLNEHGPVIKEIIPDEMWSGSAIGGRNFIIPTFWIEIAVDNYVVYREDAMRKYGLDIPESPEDILEAFRVARADWDGVNLPILNFRPSYDVAVLQLNPKIHRYYDRFPYIVKDQFFMVHQDGTVESWFESPEFKMDCEFMSTAYDDGIIHPDVLSHDFDFINNYLFEGDWLMVTYTSFENTQKNNPDISIDDKKMFLPVPEKPLIRNWGVKNCNGISITSPNPESPIKFINWLWSDQDNYDLYMYGIEGVHWEQDPDDPRGIINIRDEVTGAHNYQTGDDWKIGMIDMVRYDTSGWMTRHNYQWKEDPDAVNSIAGTFFFDASSIATEYSNVQAEAEAVMTPIVMGVQAYDDYFETAINRLKAAGLDTLIEEYQRQLDEHLANQ